MQLELHDNEAGNSLCGVAKNIDYDYQAEMQVQETSRIYSILVKWILIDDNGIRCVWERAEGSSGLPNITKRSERFKGEWEKGPNEVAV